METTTPLSMTNSQRLMTVRQCLERWLETHRDADATADGSDAVPFRESILIREGFYCGRRFEAEGWSAVWFLEEDQLKISDISGAVVMAYRGDELDRAATAPPSSATISIDRGDRGVSARDERVDAAQTRAA